MQQSGSLTTHATAGSMQGAGHATAGWDTGCATAGYVQGAVQASVGRDAGLGWTREVLLPSHCGVHAV